MSSITIAIAGPGDTTLDNAADLLNDWLGFGKPDKDGYYAPSANEITLILPVTDDTLSDGLEAILDWSEKADLPFIAVTDEGSKGRKVTRILKDAVEVVEVQDVADKIASLLSESDDDEAYFVALWGDGDAFVEHLLDLTDESEIPAKDLTAGLDDLIFAQEGSAEEPAPDPEPEPEDDEIKPVKRRGRRKAAEEEIEAEEQPLTEEAVKDPEPEPKKTRGRKPKEPEPQEPLGVDLEAQRIAREKASESIKKATREVGERFREKEQEEARKAHPVDDLENRFAYHPATTPERQGAHSAIRAAALNFARILTNASPAGRELSLAITNAEQAMFWANAAVARQDEPGAASPAPKSAPADKETPEDPEEPTAPKRGRGRPRKDGSPAQPRTESYIENDDGTLVKRGRGRVPRDVKTVQLTAQEIKDAIADGRILEDEE